MISFRIDRQSTRSRARLGTLTTPHGTVATPAFVPVATQATIKTLTSEQVLTTNSQLLICNTFHLHLKPGEEYVAASNGLHEFMQWPRPLMTDSGGFQVFSLGFGRDHGVGKILKARRDETVSAGQQPRLLKITDEGVEFTSPIDGSKVFLSPETSIAIQEKLGADIIFAFDEATSPVANEEYTRQSLEKTHRWSARCLNALQSNQALFGIVQGGKFKELRLHSARTIGAMPFAGFGIGGEYGDDKSLMRDILQWTFDELPEDKPRHVLGVGHLEDIPELIKAGADTFDCIVPTHYARHGTAFTSEDRLDLTKRVLLNDQQPLDPACTCLVCQNYSRAYVAHLVRAKEVTGLQLLTLHNLHYFNTYVARLREKIKYDDI